MLLVIVGMPCSGKTTALDVCRELGAKTVAAGDVIREEITRRGLPYDERTDREVSGLFHGKGRERVLVERVLEKAGGDPKKNFVAVDGFRSVEQLNILQKKTGTKPIVIALDAPFEDRLKRCLLRHRFPNETETYLRSRDNVEKERGLADLLEHAAYRFSTGGMDEATFRREFKEFLQKTFSLGKENTKKNEAKIQKKK